MLAYFPATRFVVIAWLITEAVANSMAKSYMDFRALGGHFLLTRLKRDTITDLRRGVMAQGMIIIHIQPETSSQTKGHPVSKK